MQLVTHPSQSQPPPPAAAAGCLMKAAVVNLLCCQSYRAGCSKAAVNRSTLAKVTGHVECAWSFCSQNALVPSRGNSASSAPSLAPRVGRCCSPML
jgi:hypothetical protein